MKKQKLSLAISAAMLLSATAAQAGPQVEVLDKRSLPAGSFLAYTEFELSGEPLAESLGLDLDVLDPDQVNQPTAFDYSAGIESYEYSEEAMYALNYQSQSGPHLANGPLNKQRGGDLGALGQRFMELADSVKYPAEEIPLNLYPISLPYQAALPEFAGQVDTSVVNGDEIEHLDANGKARNLTTQTPAYYRDYASLAWTDSQTEKVINPASVGGILLKEVMWSQDFLGGMHVIDSDEEVEASTSTQDQDGVHALGVSAVDGMNGVILTEMSLDKLLILQDQLGFDGNKLGAAITPDYDPAKGVVWFPHQIAVTEGTANGVKAIDGLKVTDTSSSLRDTWLLLWPVSEYFAFSDQREANSGQNPAFAAVFDGAPFAAAPKANVDADNSNDVKADDAFSVASNLAGMLFKNLDALHFNRSAGTLVDSYNGKQGQHVTTYDAAYSLVALSIFQRSQDALPVGYASAEGGDVDLKSAQGKRALEIIRAQANFILANLIGDNGLAIDGTTLGGKADQGQSLDAQFAAIRGLTAAFLATEDSQYRDAARKLYLAVDEQLFDKAIDTWAQQPGQATEHTPWTAAAISSGLREAMLHLKNEEGENAAALELETLAQRYVSWFKGVVNGSSTDQGMQLAEWLGDSGEQYVEGEGEDIDADNVPKVTSNNTAMVMAAKVRVSAN
ncbi:hypothetical protein [Motiliproteus sp.]|uniref:hypothetical protein n=1 Tax=Motiliproteus sp. TaxID=1898955 RepID=UPI003BAC75D2